MQNSELEELLNAKSINNVKRINPSFKKALVNAINFIGRIFFSLRRNRLPSAPQKILFISLYFNGDILFHSVFFELVKKLYPEAELHIWIKSRTKGMMSGYPYLKKVFVFDDIRTRRYDENVKLLLKEKWKFFKELRKEKYDLIFDLTGLFWTAAAIYIASPKYSSGFNFQGFGFIYNFETEPVYNGHLIDKHINIIEKDKHFQDIINNDVIQRKPIYYIEEKSVKAVDKLFDEHNILSDSRKIILHTTAGWDAKKWNIDNFVQLSKLLNSQLDIILIGGKEDIENGKIINYHIKSKIYNFTGILSINESAEVIKRANLYVGADSGPLYLAEAVGTPTLSLFGPTNPLFSAPRGVQHDYMYKTLFCSAEQDQQNCKLLAGLNCRTLDCMKLITPEEAAEMILSKVKGISEKKD